MLTNFLVVVFLAGVIILHIFVHRPNAFSIVACFIGVYVHPLVIPLSLEVEMVVEVVS